MTELFLRISHFFSQFFKTKNLHLWALLCNSLDLHGSPKILESAKNFGKGNKKSRTFLFALINSERFKVQIS